MCGIAGLITRSESTAHQAVDAMSCAMVHRGPDDAGHQVIRFGHQFLGFGQRRLSILDLSPAGHQPMVNPETGDQIVFNGEIYNFAVLREELKKEGFQFRGHSDTEVLLYGMSRWGTSFLPRLQGMYAFGFFDARQQKLILARDPMGIKPLYVAQTGEHFLFASEVRALLKSGLIAAKLDQQAVASLLAYGAVQEPSTIIQGIRAFPSGCFQTIDGSGAASSPVAFWKPPKPTSPLSIEDASDKLATTMDDAVRDHLVADVPVGVFLSSGLDSTIIAGLAAKHTPHLRSFTVGFVDQPDMSELALAAETARQFGLQHTEIRIEGHDAERAAAEWLKSLDQPSMDGLNVYIISKAIRSQGIIVALSGQGGDELFGGYPSFQDVPHLHSRLRSIAWLPRGIRAMLGSAVTLRRSEAVKQKLQDMLETDASVMELALQRRRTMSRRQLAALGIDSAALGLESSFLSREAIDRADLSGDAIADISLLESRFYQGNMLLRDGDANGMAHSLEIRVPILDQRVVDLAMSLPGQVRLPEGRANKHLLRTAFAPLLRRELLQQKKRGFTLPIRRWMIGPLREMSERSLARLKSTNLLREQGIDEIWNAFLREPESPIWTRAFTLVVLGSYIDRINSAN